MLGQPTGQSLNVRGFGSCHRLVEDVQASQGRNLDAVQLAVVSQVPDRPHSVFKDLGAARLEWQ
eukprot:761405-Hanusia_phi.AAC.7